MSPRPRRDARHPDLETAIKETAWKQIAELGAAALNLRAIARTLGIAAPSIYNYFPNRDALVTALIVDAFASLAASQAAAIAAVPEQAHARRLLALGLDYRAWAIAKPERYQLIFGTPLAGYHAPLAITQVAGQLQPEADCALPPPLQAMLAAWRAERGPADEQVQFLGLSIWGQVHGLVSVEIGHQYPPFITDPGEVYRHALELLVRRYLPNLD